MRPATAPIRLYALCAVVALSCTTLAAAQDPVGPLTTNNGVSACVQFGSCTDGGSYATTETQQSAITSPASSQAIAPPTNAIESSNAISALAASGAAAAYSSRVANGQGSGNAPDGATSSIDTATVIAGSPPSANSATSSGQSSSGNAAAAGIRAPLALDTPFAPYFWTLATLVAGAAAGGAFVL